MAAFMSGFKDGGQVIVPVPLEFTDPYERKLVHIIGTIPTLGQTVQLNVRYNYLGPYTEINMNPVVTR
jgi:hypothetical protein